MSNSVKAGDGVQTSVADVTAWWSTGVSRIAPGEIDLRGYPIADVINNLDFVSTIWLMTRGELPTAPQKVLLEAALVASVDHGPQAPSIASARMAITCGVGLNSAIANGVNVLGDAHGGAGQQGVQMLNLIVEQVRNGANLEDAVAELLEGYRVTKTYVPGFGHRFHPRDPRRDPLLARVDTAVAEGAISGEYLAVGLAIEAALAAGRTRAVPMNIDGITAIIYAELGVEPELARGLFILSRSVGITAHAWEERQSGRRIKGPIPPPLLADYVGVPLRSIPVTE